MNPSFYNHISYKISSHQIASGNVENLKILPDSSELITGDTVSETSFFVVLNKFSEIPDFLVGSGSNLTKIVIEGFASEDGSGSSLFSDSHTSLRDEFFKISLTRNANMKSLKIFFSLAKALETERKISTLTFMTKAFELSNGLSSYDFKFQKGFNIFYDAFGSARKTILGLKARYEVGFESTSKDDFKNIKDLMNSTKGYLFSVFDFEEAIGGEDLTEDGLKFEDFFKVLMTNPYDPKLLAKSLGAGQEIKIILEETG